MIFEKPPIINSHVGGLGYWNENRYKEYEWVKFDFLAILVTL